MLTSSPVAGMSLIARRAAVTVGASNPEKFTNWATFAKDVFTVSIAAILTLLKLSRP
jgi:hypothetical protein